MIGTVITARAEDNEIVPVISPTQIVMNTGSAHSEKSKETSHMYATNNDAAPTNDGAT